MIRSIAIALACASAASLAPLPARSVRLDPGGLGQALIYPYYTARSANGNSWTTAFTVVNTRDKPKVVKVRFREGRHGRAVWEANVYLGPNDVWTGGVVQGSDGAAHLVSSDASCIDPPHPGTRDAGAFSTGSFTGSAADGAGTGVDRTLEGFFEVIEMATLAGDTAGAVNSILRGVPADCPSVVGSGKTRNLEAPEGGLSGTAFLINLASGLSSPFSPIALADLTTATFYSDAGAPGTDYDSPEVTPMSFVVVPRASETGFGTSPSGYLLRSTWSRGVDAVSAVLMAASIQNEYALDSATHSNTDWVVTMPTARFYLDGASPAAPFDTAFTASGACELVHADVFNREQAGQADSGVGFPEPPPGPPPSTLCWAASIVSYRNGSFYSPSTPTTPSLVLDSSNVLGYTVSSIFQDGFVLMDLLPDGPGLTSLASSTAIELATGNVVTGAHKFAGLPVAGFAAWKFDNGLLSCNGQACNGSFGVNYPHRTIPGVTRIP